MRRPRLLVALLAGLSVAACGPSGASAPLEPERPNVLLIVLDTLRRDHLSTYGYRLPTSPQLDALGRAGVVFEDCLAQSSWTLPSMISLMTGQPLFSNLYKIPAAIPMLGERFAEAGYRTGAFVANSLVGAEAGFERGFDVFEVRPKSTAAWDAKRLARHATEFLAAQADADEPFLLWLHFLDTHAPYTPAERPSKRPPAEVLDAVDLRAVERVLAEQSPEERERLSYQIGMLAHEVQRYDAELSELDAQLGRLFDTLEKLGLASNTYIAVVADHGEGLFRRPQHPDRLNDLRAWREKKGEKLRLADLLKMEHDGWLFDELVATPWILAGPGLGGGRRVAELVTNMDVLPTLAGLCGLPAAPTAGRDLSRALLGGQPVPAAEFAVTACTSAMAARLPDGRKLILPEARLTERFGLTDAVFDLSSDPFEQRPLPLDDTTRQLRERLRAAAAADPFRAAYEAPDEATLEGLRELGYVR